MAQNRRPENQRRRTDGTDNRIVQYGEVRSMSRSRTRQSSSQGRTRKSSGQSRVLREERFAESGQNQRRQDLQRQRPQGQKTQRPEQARHPSQRGKSQKQRAQKQRAQKQRAQNQKMRRAASMHQGRGRKRRRRRTNRKRVLILLGILAFFVLLGYLETLVFQTKKIEVAGNHYVTDTEVTEWIKSDKYSKNSLYLLWRYNRDDVQQLPAVGRIQVKLKSPQKALISVKEKTFSGRVESNGGFLYFDRDGIASLKTQDVIEGVTYITGMDISQDKVVMGKVIPVKEKKVFQNINDVSEKLKAYDLVPDKIHCENSELTLYFGNFRVQIGSSSYEKKLAQIPPILTKLNELYADQTGTLHLENYDKTDGTIRFVPEPIEETTADAEPVPNVENPEGTDLTQESGLAE